MATVGSWVTTSILVGTGCVGLAIVVTQIPNLPSIIDGSGFTAPPTVLGPGTFTGSVVGASDVVVTSTVPSGWELQYDGALLLNFASTPTLGVILADVANIYADPCHWVPLDPPVGPTVDDLVSALEDTPNFRATGTRKFTLDGFVGRRLEFTTPDFRLDECMQDRYAMWEVDRGDIRGPFMGGAPYQRYDVRILDVDGTRVVIISWSFPDTSAEDLSELEEILESIQIG